MSVKPLNALSSNSIFGTKIYVIKKNKEQTLILVWYTIDMSVCFYI